MQVFSILDYGVYLAMAYLVMIHEYGVTSFILFTLENLYFVLIKLPYIYMINRCIKPYPSQSPFSQKATGCGFIIKESLKHYFTYVQNREIAKVFFDGRVFQAVNKFRFLENFGRGLGDTIHENLTCPTRNLEEIKGTWVYSKSRAKKQPHDLLILYIHGGLGFGNGSGHMYTEYLSIFNVMLSQMGFKNPGIFIPQFSSSYEKYPNQLAYLLRSYQYVATLADDTSNIVVMGDSTGATLALSLLKALDGPSRTIMRRLNFHVGVDDYSERYTFRTFTHLQKPSAAILISPVTNLFVPDLISNGDDYLTPQILKSWVNKYVPAELRNSPDVIFIDPGQYNDVSFWRRALPKNGVIVSYGSEELLCRETEIFIELLKKTGVKIRVHKQTGQVHDWPLLGFYTEKSVGNRELSLRIYSGLIASLLL